MLKLIKALSEHNDFLIKLDKYHQTRIVELYGKVHVLEGICSILVIFTICSALFALLVAYDFNEKAQNLEELGCTESVEPTTIKDVSKIMIDRLNSQKEWEEKEMCE